MSRGAAGLFYQLFDFHPAHIALLDLDGRILATNLAWNLFGLRNGLSESYRFVGLDYIEVSAAAATASNDPYAARAIAAIASVLSGIARRLEMQYPCHAPDEKRWFRMLVESQTPESPTVIIAHTYLGPAPRR